MADYGGAISSQSRDISLTSDEDISEQSHQIIPGLVDNAGGSQSSKSVFITTGDGGSTIDGGSKKRRGRPLGSKNKPKPPPFVVTSNISSAMKPVFLEISAGSDITDTIQQFAHTNNVAITVINVTGSVSNVTLGHPSAHAPPISLPGTFPLISLHGSFLGSNAPHAPFGITLAGDRGQVLGGIVAGELVAATRVNVLASTFVNPAFNKLPPSAQVNQE